MRPILLAIGMLLLVVGVSLLLVAWPAVQRCESIHLPTCAGNQSCPALVMICDVPLVIFAAVVALVGVVLVVVGALTKSRDQIADEVLSERSR